MTRSQRRKIEWYLTLPHMKTDAAKSIIRKLLAEIDALEKDTKKLEKEKKIWKYRKYKA